MIRKALSNLPATLDETYDRILCGIDNDYFEYALSILQWLACSARPLLLEEVAEVIAIRVEGDVGFDRDMVLANPLDLLRICSSLITITKKPKSKDKEDKDDEEGDNVPSESGKEVVDLAHYSVKEYLISDRIQRGRAARYSLEESTSNLFIAKSCLHYLLQFRDSGSLSKKIAEASKLAIYAAQFWSHHTKNAGKDTKSVNALIMELFSLRDDAYLNSIRFGNLDGLTRYSNAWSGVDLSRTIDTIPDPLYYASLTGLPEIVGLLINKAEVDVNAKSGSLGSALAVASYHGQKKIVEQLLKAGADVNARLPEWNDTALHCASLGRRIEIVELLLKAGADVNARSEDHGTPLHFASMGGRIEIVEQLLKAGADVNVQAGYFNTALQCASLIGHLEVVERLLKTGADVNARSKDHETALHGASARGHIEIVERLLMAGAHVNVQARYYNTPLQNAIFGGHIEVVERLLKAGADVNAQGERYGNALSIAVSQGRLKIGELLLNAGAHVNIQDIYNMGTSMEWGDRTMIELVLNVGADIGADIDATTPSIAASRGYFKLLTQGTSHQHMLLRKMDIMSAAFKKP